MRELVLDAGVLRVVALMASCGLPGLLSSIAVPAVRVPPEVYNADEDATMSPDDVGLSVLARDIQAVRRRAASRHWASTQRERASLSRAERLREHVADGSLIIDPLWPEELPQRESLRDRHGIGRGEAAAIVLAKRYDVAVIYVSHDSLAPEVARIEGVHSVVIRNALAA